jgi:hypothetical protein
MHRVDVEVVALQVAAQAAGHDGQDGVVDRCSVGVADAMDVIEPDGDEIRRAGGPGASGVER